MIKNYFILKELARYLDSVLGGFQIKEVFTQEKNKFVMCLYSNENSELKYLEFSCDSTLPYLILKQNFSKAKKNTVNLLDEIKNLKIKSVGLFNDDRVINFSLSNFINIHFFFFTGKVNSFICKNDIIINVFKNRNLYVDKNINDLFKPKSIKSGENKKIETIKDFFKSKYIKFGNSFFKELLHNLNLNEKDALDDKKRLIEEEFDKFNESLKTPEYILYEKESKAEISLMMFNHLQTYNAKSFTNINEMLSEYIKDFYKVERRKTVKDSRLLKLQSKIDVVDKKIMGLMKQIEVSKQSDQYYIYGEHILSNLQNINKGDKELRVKDATKSDVIIIKLDESLTPSDNAQKYFKKYKGQKDSLKVLKDKVKTFKKEKEKYSNELKRLSEIQDYKTLSKMNKKQEIKEKEDKETSMFRKFILNDDYEVWVGKDSKSNDLLTTKFSSPNDLWFHVRGASGSHTVLKITNKKKILEKRIIQTTASIAAYYSKARNASNVPVAYCERKYVKKKKGFKPGSVVMAREKVIFVKPALPEITGQ